MKYTERNSVMMASIMCPKHGKTKTYDLGIDGICVGMGCSRCFENLPTKQLEYQTREKKLKLIRK